MEVIIKVFLGILTSYFVIGIFFALYFLFFGATKIDPLMKNTKMKVRFLLIPGLIVTWPFLISKLFKSKTV